MPDMVARLRCLIWRPELRCLRLVARAERPDMAARLEMPDMVARLRRLIWWPG